MTDHDAWLNLVNEKAIEPDLPICDAFHHFYNVEGRHYWGTSFITMSRYLGEDFVKDASGGHNVKKTIVVQAQGNYQQGQGRDMSPIDETTFVMKQLKDLETKIDVGAGFVGYADIATGKAVQPILEAHLEAGKKRFKGIRYSPMKRPETSAPSILSDSKFHEGFAFLAKYKLTYELNIGFSQFSELADLARKFPNTPIIIVHLGFPFLSSRKPDERREMIEEWQRGIRLVAPVDNIYIKLGGSGMPNRGFGFNKKLRPPTSEEIVEKISTYYQSVIEQFGPKRCMFESNFPPDRESFSYTVIWNAFKFMTKSYTKTERACMFFDTANKVYSL